MDENKIVIAGISGRFPQSSNIEKFWENLIQSVDMITEDDQRWPKGFGGIPSRKGTLVQNLEDFDADFFSINTKHGEKLDPHIRQLLEVTWEAIFDGGFNPEELRGRNIGVYVGANSQETITTNRSSVSRTSGYDITTSSGCMYSNRISYEFDFNGPSLTIDTYCSSSLVALHEALSALRNGQIEGAIVGGVNLLLDPLLTLQVQKLGALSNDGKCKAFDKEANGYVRSEAIVAVFLTKATTAQCSYATILHSKANHDGFKKEGVTFPSAEAQETLLKEAYEEVKLEPKIVNYVECHGTGTSIGDQQELTSISKVFTIGRNEPLLIGSVKSNMGHSEAASGLCGLIKLCLAFQNGQFPPNLHFKQLTSSISSSINKKIKIVDEIIPLSSKNVVYAGLNSFGIGGSNVHVIIKRELTTNNLEHQTLFNGIPVLIPVSNRTNKGLIECLTKIKQNQHNPVLIIQLQKIHKIQLKGYSHRGYILDGKEYICEQNTKFGKRPLWLVFPGMGTQWIGVIKHLIEINVIKESIEKSSQIAINYGLNLMEILYTQCENTLRQHMSLIFITIGMALIDLLVSLDVEPDGFVGHSAGEYLCAYIDGCLTREQAITIHYLKDDIVNCIKGDAGMVSIGLSWEQAMESCPPGIFPACHNAKNNVTVSGKLDDLQIFTSKLKSKGIFVRDVNSGGVGYHSPLLGPVQSAFKTVLTETIPHPQKRSVKWISTSIPSSNEFFNDSSKIRNEWSWEYALNNFVSPVFFYDAILKIPSNAIIVEIGTHSLLSNILKRSLPETVTVLPTLIKNSEDNTSRLLDVFGKLYLEGFNPNLTKLYPYLHKNQLDGSFPVNLSNFVNWNYNIKLPIPDYVNKKEAGRTYKVSLEDKEWEYLIGHKVNGKIIFPATGYLVLVWKAFAAMNSANWKILNIQFSEIEIYKATILEQNDSVEFHVDILPTGAFEMTRNNEVVCGGSIQQTYSTDEEDVSLQWPLVLEQMMLDKNDLYKDFRLRGYEYSKNFQGIQSSNIQGNLVTIEWNELWIPFLDTILQSTLISLKQINSGIYLPTKFKTIKIKPKIFQEQCKLHDNLAFAQIVPSSSETEVAKVFVPGVSIQGIKLNWTYRNTNIVEPVLQKWKFVPYKDDEGEFYSIFDALNIIAQIILENLPLSLTTIKILDATQIHETFQSNILEIFRKCIKHILPQKTVEEASENQEDIRIGSNFDELKFCTANQSFILIVSMEPVAFEETNSMFNLVSIKNTSNLYFYLFKKKRVYMSSPLLFPISVDTVGKWLEPLKKLLSIDSNEINQNAKNVWLICEDISHSGVIGFTNCLRKEVSEEIAKIHCWISSSQLSSSIFEQDLIMNVVDEKTGRIGSYRSIPYENQASLLSNACLTFHTKKRSLQWIQPEKARVNAHTIKIQCSSLNFRDLMLVQGQLSPDAIPGFSGICPLGMEFVGIQNEEKKPIMCIVDSGGIGTHLINKKPLLSWVLPQSWTIEEGATVPIAYSTAYYALMMRAKIETGETILITSGTSSVGQASIRLALSLNCEIFTTVGTENKKKLLLEMFPKLEENHILDSGSTKFKDHILKMTNGKGVEIVLNSLAKEKLEASIQSLANGGRFLEIGKFDLSKNTKLGMEIFLRNISFHGILLDSLFLDGHEQNRAQLTKLVADGIEKGVVRPLKYRLFKIDQIEEAFSYMRNLHRTEKVLIKTHTENEPARILTQLRTYFDPKKIYFIFGGIGGFGLELTKWMVDRGCRHFVLLSRSGKLTGYAKLQLFRWKEQGVKIFVEKSEHLNSIEEMRNLFDFYTKSYNLGGIFNLATILNDALLQNQTALMFEQVLKPKVALTQMLDELSRIDYPSLEYFIVFSSVTSIYGNIGQTNYGFGNSATERICELRRKDGYSGLAIAWGAIEHVGLAYERSKHNQMLVAGTLFQSLPSCFNSLDQFLSGIQSENISVVSSLLIPNKTEKLSEAKKSENLNLIEKIGRILGILDKNRLDLINEDASLGELGLDSFMLIETKEILENHSSSKQKFSDSQIRNIKWSRIKELSKLSSKGNT